jgi:type I restriction enzyme, S subunit
VTLPTGWARGVAFSDVLDYQGGSQPPKSEFTSEPGAGRIRLLQIRDFASDAKAVYIKDNGKWPRCGSDDIMIGRYGASVGKILTGKAGAYNVALVKLLFDRAEIEPKFLFHWLHLDTFQGKLASVSRSAQDGFNKEDLADIPFPLPPLAEQRRIVAKLDTLTARLTRARTELDRVATMAKAMRRAALLEAFDQPDTPLLPLTNLGKLQRGHSKHRPRNDPRLIGGKYPFVQTGDIRSADRFLTTYKTTYSDFGLAQSRLWPRGTLAITIAANIAETAILGIDACFPDSVVGFTPEQDVTTAEYVEYFFRVARADLDRFASATAQKNINLETLRGLQVPCPSISCQSAIVERLNTAFARADRLEAEAARARALLDRLEAAILARAFRGELVPQDPTDEPATALLNRIREARAAAPPAKRGRRAMAEA